MLAQAYQQKLVAKATTAAASTYADASLDELISELDFFAPAPSIMSVGETRTSANISPAASVVSNSTASRADSDACEIVVEGQVNKSKKSSKEVPKADYAVDHLDHKLLHPLLQTKQVEENNSFPCKLVTNFKKKYYRFDNKSLQCFPGCSKFGDVREARMLGQDHRAGGRSESFCTNAVLGSVQVNPLAVPTASLRVVGRFLSATPEVGVLPESDAPLLDVGAIVNHLPEANCVPGHITGESKNVDAWGRREVTFVMQPDEAWFFNLTLPRHRRNAACAAHKVPLFVFELLVFVQQGHGFKLGARTVSAPFEVASIRTLIREALAFRQQHLPGHASKDLCEDDEMEGVSDKPAPITLSARRHLAANYSSTAQRVRLAEANRKEEEKKKKQELVIEIIPEPQASSSSSMDIVSPSPVPFNIPSFPPFAPAPMHAFSFQMPLPAPLPISNPASGNDVLLDFPDLFLSDSFEPGVESVLFPASDMNMGEIFPADLNLNDDGPC